MNKFVLVTIASALLSISAFAAPKVGDTVTMEGSMAGIPVTIVESIISYNANTDVFVVRQSQTMGTQTQTVEQNAPSQNIMSEETGAMVVANCAAMGGSLETINVKAGAFNACKLPIDATSTVWVASVPFGMVRMDATSPDGNLSVGLSSFSRGQ